MEDDTKENMTSRTTWLRLFFMFIFGLLLVVALYVAVAVAFIQFGFVLFTGERRERLSGFANQLSQYINQCVRFVLFDSEEQPFPFDDWPKVPVAIEDQSPEK
jgi:hypothetical protein